MNAEEPHDMNDETSYMNEKEPYHIARANDSDDDRPIGELTESDVEMMKHVLPGVDIRVHEFNLGILNNPVRQLQKDGMMSF
jgi:hypothetical protein